MSELEVVGDPVVKTTAVSLELFGWFDAANKREPDDDGSSEKITHVARLGVNIIFLPPVPLGPKTKTSRRGDR